MNNDQIESASVEAPASQELALAHRRIARLEFALMNFVNNVDVSTINNSKRASSRWAQLVEQGRNAINNV